ncbi:hypothetical protein [Alicyclobacillus ferrooxydans]|uniref:Uncharacterized protein n=1 Tax=Alicyclobacillus ferrooxydans TaxID=471514 RepID=A0A0P9CG76_9BACL|nr:hypothetical protein [Alicyclobacillus ferrooxydans]KPV42030.1 hypothetical protein AN477_19875 [Alicyclobacillus ferrooxydans]
MGQENQEARLAVAVNDIEWIKDSQRSTNRGIEQLQTTLTQYMKEQDDRSEKFATKEELSIVRRDVTKLKEWRWKVGGGLAALSFLMGLAAEALRSWKG